MLRSVKKLHFLFFLCLIILWLAVPSYAAQKLNKTKLTLRIGDTETLKLSGTKKTITWKSSKPAVAKVTKKGKVTARRKGTAKISATVGKKTYTCRVTVKAAIKVHGAVTDHKVRYTASLDGNKQLTIRIKNKGANTITLGWAGDFVIVYQTTKTKRSATIDALQSLQNTGDLYFNRITEGNTKSFFADLSAIPGNLKSITLKQVYPLGSSGLPQFISGSIDTLTYNVKINMKAG